MEKVKKEIIINYLIDHGYADPFDFDSLDVCVIPDDICLTCESCPFFNPDKDGMSKRHCVNVIKKHLLLKEKLETWKSLK